MIRINRNKLDVHGAIIRPELSWVIKSLIETKLLVRKYKNGDRTFTFKRSVYQDIRIRTPLEEVFNYKCCYCERLIEDYDFDVEHFRPSGKPIECTASHPAHFGYFWLIYNWKNLYLSCSTCNRTRTDRDGYNAVSNGRTSGKLNSFPLFNPRLRAFSPACQIRLEEPVLLDPCLDDPTLHLRFDINGRISDFNGSLRGKESIRILGLDRGPLNRARSKIVKKAVASLKSAFAARQAGDGASERIFTNNYIELTKDEERYAGAVRCIVSDPVAFNLILEYGIDPNFFLSIKLLI